MKKNDIGQTAEVADTRVRRLTQQERSHATRERVIGATIALLHREGYSGATTLAIRRAAGVSLGALQHQFPTKAELMAAVQERLTGERYTHFETALEGGSTPLERVTRMFDVAESLIGTPLFAASIEIELARRADRELDQAIAVVDKSLIDRFHALIGRGTAGFDGRMAQKVDSLELLTSALIRGLTVVVVTGGDLDAVRAAFRVWRDLAIHSLGAEPARAKAHTKAHSRGRAAAR